MISKYVVLFVFLVFLSACAQILLKISAGREYDSRIRAYLNPLVLTGYSIFVVTTFFSIYCYRWIPLKQGGVLQMFSYIFILVLSRIILKEKISVRKIAGMILIISGILVFYIS